MPRTCSGRIKKFGICTENIVFGVLLIFCMVTFIKSVDSQQNDSSSSSPDTENDGAEEDTTELTTNLSKIVDSDTDEETSTTEETKEEDDDEGVLKIGMVYQDPRTAKIFHEAINLLKKTRPDIMVKVVEEYFAQDTMNAIALVQDFCQTMDRVRPDLVMDFTQTGIPSEGVALILKTLKIPTVATAVGGEEDVREWSRLSKDQEKYLVRIIPPSDTIDQVVRALTESLNMTNAAIFFDETQIINHKYKSILADMPTFHKVMTLYKDPTRFQKEFEKLIKARFTNFFLIGSVQLISDTISRISRIESVNFFSDQEYSWVAISMEKGNLTCTNCKRNNISLMFVKPSSDHLKEPSQVIQNLDDEFYFQLTNHTISDVWDMKMSNNWPLTRKKIPCTNFDVSHQYAEPMVDLLAGFDKRGKSDRSYRMRKNGRHQPMFVLNIHNVRRTFVDHRGQGDQGDKPWIFYEEIIGQWLADNPDLQIFGDPPETKELESYRPKTVYNVVTVVNPPYVYENTSCDPAQVKQKNPFAHCFYGYSIDLVDRISKELEFNYRIYAVQNYSYIQNSPTRRWSGIIGELVNRNADIAIGALTLMPERELVVDFTRPHHPTVGFSFIMKKSTVPEHLFQFMTVLENDVWLCILAAYFFTTFLLFIFDRYSPSSYQNNKEAYDTEIPRLFTLRECLWFCFTSLTPQGGGEAPRGLSGRLVASTWWLFAFIIIASYTANLAAFLTVSRLAKPIEDLEGLINQHRVLYFPVIHSSTWYYFDRMAYVEERFYEIWRDMSLDDNLSDYNRSHLAVWTYPISDKYTRIWQNMMENNPPRSLATAVDRVVNGNKSNPFQKFALIGEETDMKYQTLIHCTVKVVGETFSKRPYAMAVQKGSPLKNKINNVLDKLERRRELEYFYRKWWEKNPHDQKCPRDYDVSDGINLANLGGVFMVGVGGLVFVVFVMLMEVAYCKIKNRSIEILSREGDDNKVYKKYLRKMFINNQKTDFGADSKFN